MTFELQPGTLLRDKWRLEKFLGQGGMSSVYAASHRNGMRGAIKVLHRELCSDEALKRRFLREGYLANKVDHPGAVKVLDEDTTEDGVVFLVMELLEGETLKQRWLKNERHLDLKVTLDIVDTILDVLEAAHAHAIVHRDLKPDNIFLVNDGSLKILDFGIARLTDPATGASVDITNSSAMIGTPAFMPPEQALAQWKVVDGRTDLFAVAATAFTMLSGALVHQGTTVQELLVSAATQPARSLRKQMPEVDAGIGLVIDRALAFEMDTRWPNAATMRSALKQARIKAQSRTVRLAVSGPMQTPATITEDMTIATDSDPTDGDPTTKIEVTVGPSPASTARTLLTTRRVEPRRDRRFVLALGVAALVATLVALWAMFFRRRSR